MLTGIRGEMVGGCEWPTAASREPPPSGAIATIALVVTLITSVRAVV
jgi:hypothetical protein